MVWMILGAIVLAVVLAVIALLLYTNARLKKIPGMTYQDCLQYSLSGNKDAVITVGVLKNNEASYTVYGEDARELPRALHTYEIGSLTKTFTASLIAQAVEEGKLSLEDTLDRLLPLPAGEYPTVSQVLTHTSGLKSYYMNGPLLRNTVSGKNSFYGIPDATILQQLSSVNGKLQESPFSYSNFGYAVLGMVLKHVYGKPYDALVNEYAQSTLGLTSTQISDRTGDLGKYWDWNRDDAYLSAGAITSNVADMLQYAKYQLEEQGTSNLCHAPLRTIDTAMEAYTAMGIHMDAIGMAWIIDEHTGVIWHNGGTSNYNSYLGFCPKTNTAVVVLSNLAPNNRIPATVLGIKLLEELQ